MVRNNQAVHVQTKACLKGGRLLPQTVMQGLKRTNGRTKLTCTTSNGSSHVKVWLTVIERTKAHTTPSIQHDSQRLTWKDHQAAVFLLSPKAVWAESHCGHWWENHSDTGSERNNLLTKAIVTAVSQSHFIHLHLWENDVPLQF